LTLGVKPNFEDYSSKDATLIRKAPVIYYPSLFYAALFASMGKKTFPGYHNYLCVQDKIKQTALFKLQQIQHPETRIFFGRHQQKAITHYFSFPFIAKIPRGSALGRGVFLIKTKADLADYCRMTRTAYIQQYLPTDRDIRVVVIGTKVAHAYWRIASGNEFRSNIAQGGSIHLDNIPSEALDLALYTARKCRWDDVGIDILPHGGKFYVLEGNMKYGRQGFVAAGIDYIEMMEGMIDKGEI
jgi:ribosomal protein S6--L-glutamate ligase